MSEQEINDIKYIENKRDIELEKFVTNIKTSAPFGIIEDSYKSIIKLEKQMRLMEDALVAKRIMEENNNCDDC